MKGVALLFSICLFSISCSNASKITGLEKTELSKNGDLKSLRIVSKENISGTIAGKNYSTKELKDGINNVEYGAEIILKSSDNNDYLWIFNNGETPHYSDSITFNIKANLIISVEVW